MYINKKEGLSLHLTDAGAALLFLHMEFCRKKSKEFFDFLVDIGSS